MKFRNKLGLLILIALILADDATAVYTDHAVLSLEFIGFIVILAIGSALLLYEHKHYNYKYKK